MNFIYIYSKKNIIDLSQTILEVLDETVSMSSHTIQDNKIIIYYNYVKSSLEDLTSILMADLYINANLYESISYEKEEDIVKAISLLDNLFFTYDFNENYLNNKKLLEALYNKKDKNLEKLVLNSYYNDIEMYNTIKTFLEENQNSSIASQKLYLHRNTLNQRLDKFYDKTGFNVKKFIDAYLIYSIIK